MSNQRQATADDAGEWPKRFSPGEEVPAALQENDAVVLFEGDVVEGVDGAVSGVELVAYHLEHSPSAWIRLIGVHEADLEAATKHSLNEQIMNDAYHRDISLPAVSWYADEEVTADSGGVTSDDIETTLTVLEGLREVFSKIGMTSEAQQVNEVHCLVDDHGQQSIEADNYEN
jgi:hypothetical protein